MVRGAARCRGIRSELLSLLLVARSSQFVAGVQSVRFSMLMQAASSAAFRGQGDGARRRAAADCIAAARSVARWWLILGSAALAPATQRRGID